MKSSAKAINSPGLGGKPRMPLSSRIRKQGREFKAQGWLQAMAIPGIIWLIIFCYIPMYGVVIAFKDYRPGSGFFSGEWVGLKHFIAFFSDKYAIQAVWNTLKVSVIKLLVGFPAPILFALLLNELQCKPFKKVVQSVSYLPFFVSWVVMWGILYSLLNLNGPLNQILVASGLVSEPIPIMASEKTFIPLAVLSDLWKGIGWNSILYLAAISSVPQEMYESAYLDGANRLQRCMHITLPSIMPTITIMLILAISGILGSNFDQHLLLSNATNITVARTIDTYVYQIGIGTGRFSYATAVNLWRSVISFFLLIGADRLSRKVSHGERGLF